MRSMREPGKPDRLAGKAKLRKREIALAIGIGTLAAVAFAGILSDGFGGPGSSFADHPAQKIGSR